MLLHYVILRRIHSNVPRDAAYMDAAKGLVPGVPYSYGSLQPIGRILAWDRDVVVIPWLPCDNAVRPSDHILVFHSNSIPAGV